MFNAARDDTGWIDAPEGGYHRGMRLRYVTLTAFSVALIVIAIAVIYWIAALQSID